MNDPSNYKPTPDVQAPETPAVENQAPEGVAPAPESGETQTADPAVMSTEEPINEAPPPTSEPPAPRAYIDGPSVGDRVRYGINSTLWAPAIVTSRRADGLLSLTVFAEGAIEYRTEVAESKSSEDTTEKWF